MSAFHLSPATSAVRLQYGGMVKTQLWGVVSKYFACIGVKFNSDVIVTRSLATTAGIKWNDRAL